MVETPPMRDHRVDAIRADVEDARKRINDLHISSASGDAYFLAEAVREACTAALEGNFGIGAVVEHEGSIVARGHNRVMHLPEELSHLGEMQHVLHAEIDAVRDLRRQRLPDIGGRSTVYTTLEPCPMCTEGMWNAGIRNAVAGAADPATGCLVSNSDRLSDGWRHLFGLTEEATKGGIVPMRHRIATGVPQELLDLAAKLFRITFEPIDRAITQQ